MDNADRKLVPALLNGALGRCPRCGDARLFGSFLKVVDHCPRCGQAWHLHSADDLPPYLVIFITGHLLVSAIIWLSDHSSLSTLAIAAVVLGLAIILTTGLLQPVKGVVVGWQWALRIGGFSKDAHSR